VVVVNDLRNGGDLSGEGAKFEEDDCSTESVIVPQESISTPTYLGQSRRSA
jgi:hypothetical protein